MFYAMDQEMMMFKEELKELVQKGEHILQKMGGGEMGERRYYGMRGGSGGNSGGGYSGGQGGYNQREPWMQGMGMQGGYPQQGFPQQGMQQYPQQDMMQNMNPLYFL